MWVWRGVAPWTWPKARNTFVFSKSKSTRRKNCNQLHAIKKKKKVKSSQVNILILDFYLLELSNCKQTKQKLKIK